MQDESGGNARSGRNDVSAFPWAAHYVPVPDERATYVRELFTELGVLGPDGWDERHLCFAPKERLFLHGRWQDGIEPHIGPGPRDRDQFARFDETMHAFREGGAFSIPSSRGRERRASTAALDAQTMTSWLDGRGFDSPWLRWLVDYACRDDYGALATDVSAWAGIHYFASRLHDDPGPADVARGDRMDRLAAARLDAGTRLRTRSARHARSAIGIGVDR